jgi:CRISPR/Cas system CMR subunit Cmr4 (Cas7 group RAMP superfamily)
VTAKSRENAPLVIVSDSALQRAAARSVERRRLKRLQRMAAT